MTGQKIKMMEDTSRSTITLLYNFAIRATAKKE